MRKIPFFSVLIPTRNRPELLEKALLSVLGQVFLDREVVVVDNSDNKYVERNCNFCKRFKEVQYYRTGGLNMAENWDYAFLKAQGEYICLLSDRLQWSSTTLLTRVYDTIGITNAPIVSWKWCNNPSFGQAPTPRSGLMGLYLSKDILNSFRNMDWLTFTYMSPRGLNSAIHKDTVVNIRKKLGSFCFKSAPDYNAAFSSLLATESIAHIDANEVYSNGLDVSNGAKCTRSYSSSAAFFKANNLDERYLKDLPVNFMTVRNSLVADYLNMRKMWGEDEKITNLNVQGYFEWLRVDLKSLSGTPQPIMNKLVDSYNEAAKKYSAPLIKFKD